MFVLKVSFRNGKNKSLNGYHRLAVLTQRTYWTINAETLDDSKRTSDKKRQAAIEFMEPTNPTQLLILSYDTFVVLAKFYEKNEEILPGPLHQNTNNVVGLIVLDEAHLIKNECTTR